MKRRQFLIGSTGVLSMLLAGKAFADNVQDKYFKDVESTYPGTPTKMKFDSPGVVGNPTDDVPHVNCATYAFQMKDKWYWTDTKLKESIQIALPWDLIAKVNFVYDFRNGVNIKNRWPEVYKVIPIPLYENQMEYKSANDIKNLYGPTFGYLGVDMKKSKKDNYVFLTKNNGNGKKGA